MKKGLALFFCLLFFSSCSAVKPVSTVDIATRYEGFVSALVTAETVEDVFQINVTKNGMSITFYVEEPEELRGLSITKTEGKATVEFGGMTVAFPAEKLPSAAPFLLLCEALETLQTPKAFSVGSGKGGLSVKTEHFSAALDPETLALQILEFPAEQVRFSFENVVFLEGK